MNKAFRITFKNSCGCTCVYATTALSQNQAVNNLYLDHPHTKPLPVSAGQKAQDAHNPIMAITCKL